MYFKILALFLALPFLLKVNRSRVTMGMEAAFLYNLGLEFEEVTVALIWSFDISTAVYLSDLAKMRNEKTCSDKFLSQCNRIKMYNWHVLFFICILIWCAGLINLTCQLKIFSRLVWIARMQSAHVYRERARC